MLYLIDGYNVTRQDPATRDLTLEEQREALLSRLRVRGASLLGPGRLVVVFDGESGIVAAASGTLPEVVFSRGRSADDEIVRIASNAAEKVVVISDDRELADRARVHGRGVEQRPSSTCFESAAARRRRGKRRIGSVREAGLPAGANRITQELKDLWLEDDDDD